jgi:peptidoglycan/xylan/chitin deacetylase (PgdA/CDA1 family)
LTFDDGPDPAYTPGVLAILKEHDIKATFFVTGRNALRYPPIVTSEIQAGHEVENHTFSHPDLRRLTKEEVAGEIGRTQSAITFCTQRTPKYFRPPRRMYNRKVMVAAAKQDLKTVLWTVGVENRSCRTPAAMAERVLSWACPGCIILAHDGDLDRTLTLQALPMIIEGYQKQGYRFVTLQELFKAEVVNGEQRFRTDTRL